MNQHQLRTMGFAYGLCLVQYLWGFFCQVNRNKHLFIGRHRIAPSHTGYYSEDSTLNRVGKV